MPPKYPKPYKEPVFEEIEPREKQATNELYAALDKDLREKWEELIREKTDKESQKRSKDRKKRISAVKYADDEEGRSAKKQAQAEEEELSAKEREYLFEKERNNPTNRRIIEYLNDRTSRKDPQAPGRSAREWDDETIEGIFKRQNAYSTLIRKAPLRRESDPADFLNGNNFSNLYGRQIDTGLVTANHYQGDWYRDRLKEIGEVQIPVSESISEDTAKMVILGEYLRKDNIHEVAQFIAAGDDKGKDNFKGQSDEFIYSGFLAVHLLNPGRPKEWGFLAVGKKSRESAKTILENADTDPKRVAESLENVYRTLLPYAMNVKEDSESIQHSTLALKALESLQDERFKPYITLSEQELREADMMRGKVELRKQMAKTAGILRDCSIDAKLADRDDEKLADFEVTKNAFEEATIDRYLDQVVYSANFKVNEYDSKLDDPRGSRSRLEAELGRNLPAVREVFRDRLRKDPAYQKALESATFGDYDKHLDDYVKKSVKDSPYRFLTDNPDTMRRNLDSPKIDYQKIWDGEKDKSSLTEFLKVSAAIAEFEKYKKELYDRTGGYTKEDLNGLKEKIAAVHAETQKAITEREEQEQPIPDGLDTICKRSAADIANIEAELRYHETEEAILSEVVKKQNEPAAIAEEVPDPVKAFSEVLNPPKAAEETNGPVTDKNAPKEPETKQPAMDALGENLTDQQEHIRIALAKKEELSLLEKAYEQQKGQISKDQADKCRKYLDEQKAGADKVIDRACARILASKTLQAKIELAAGQGVEMDYKLFADPDVVVQATKDIQKSQPFRELMKSMKPEEKAALANPDKAEAAKAADDLYKRMLDRMSPARKPLDKKNEEPVIGGEQKSGFAI